MARRLARNELRRKRPQPTAPEEMSLLADIRVMPDDGTVDYEFHGQLAALRLCLEEVPVRDREVQPKPGTLTHEWQFGAANKSCKFLPGCDNPCSVGMAKVWIASVLVCPGTLGSGGPGLAADGISFRGEIVAGYRGPSRNGIYPALNLLTEWPTNGPKLLWKYDELGPGWASAAVFGDTGRLLKAEACLCDGSVVAADGMVYIIEGGERAWRTPRMSLLKPTPDGFVCTGSFTPEVGTKELWVSPTIAAGRLFIRHGRLLACYDLRSTPSAASSP